MIADLKAYPTYKSSKQRWVESVPEHWEVLPNRALFMEVKDREHPEEEMLSVTITRGIIRQKTLLAQGSKKDASNVDKSAYKLIQPGDIAYNKMRAWQGAIGASELRGIISPAYVVMRIRKTEDMPKYFHYLYRTPHFSKEAERWSYGITSDMWSLRPEHFRIIYSPVPPPDEQSAIVHFLNWANARFETVIKAKRKVIGLLNEQKQAIIYNAITRGLDDSRPRKPSGVRGVDEIPMHWHTPLFGRLLKGIEQGWSPVGAEGELMEKQWAVLSLSSVRRGTFDPQAIKPVSLTADIPSGIEISEGDFLLTRSNARDRVGDVCVVHNCRPRTILCDLIYRLRLNPKLIDSDFLVYQLLSRVGRSQIEQDARGSSGTMPKISQSHIKAWRILLPGLEDQRSIVRHINVKTQPLVAAVDRLEREIDLVREYQTRLISDVVTGKLDVREEATRLPNEGAFDIIEDDTELGIDTDAIEEEVSL